MRASLTLVLLALVGCAGEPRAVAPVVVVLASATPGAPGAPEPAPSRTAQCDALVGIINRAVDRLGKTESTDPTGVDDLERMASQMDLVARQVDALRITSPELEGLAGEYREMCRAIAAAEHALAKGARGHDAKVRAEAERRLDEAVKREDPVVDRINALCQASP